VSESWGRAVLHRALFLGPHTCPWWFAYTFDNPVRGLVHDARSILDGLARPGDTVVDIGCGLGFFTHALAELVGPEGRVVAVDLQEAMLDRNRRRAERLGLTDRIEFRRCRAESLDLEVVADFVLAFWMVHEVERPDSFLSEVHEALRPSGRLLIAEPKGHVPEAFFSKTVERARGAGFEVRPGPAVRFSRSILCVRAREGHRG
jgi:SAM-dependent methyltransferase